MPISLRNLYASSDWPLGETRRISSADDLISIGASGKAIKRDVARSINAVAYPEFYNLAVGAVTAKMFTERTATGLTGISGIGSNRVNTIIATGKAGTITRSINGGSTFTAVTSGITADLGPAAFGNDVWVIPYATGKVLRSTNDGAAWVDTTVAGVPNFSPLGKTVFANGAFIYAYQAFVYWSADGATWVDISARARGSAGNVASITVGQGLHVLLCGNTPRYSSDGGATWASGAGRGITNPDGGLYWTGQYWVSGGYLDQVYAPVSGPSPTISGVIFSLSESLTGTVTRLTYTNSNAAVIGGTQWWVPGVRTSVMGADGSGACINRKYNSTVDAEYFPNGELLKLAKGLTSAPLTVTGGPANGLIGQFEDGTLYRYLTTSNQFGLKAASQVLELVLDAYVYATNHAPNANWYTRIK